MTLKTYKSEQIYCFKEQINDQIAHINKENLLSTPQLWGYNEFED